MTTEAQAKLGCDVLLNFLQSDLAELSTARKLWSHEKKLIRQLIVDDLVGQSVLLDNKGFEELWQKASRWLQPNLVRQRIRKESKSSTQKKHADIVLLTVLPVERDAVLVALGENPNRTEDFEEDGTFFYSTELASTRYPVKLTVWTTMIGEARNVPCAVFVNRVREHFDTNSIILIGIAGGNSKKVKIGDVVGSYQILDDAGGADEFSKGIRLGRYSLELRRRQPRIQLFDHEGRLKNLLNNFSVDSAQWNTHLGTIVEGGAKGSLRYDSSDKAIRSEYRQGLIQAGERVKKDGSLPRTAADYHDKLYAVEMEGSGFAQACRKNKLEWLVVRGISDCGDRRKRDKAQSFAASAAATLVVQFLKGWFPISKPGDVEF